MRLVVVALCVTTAHGFYPSCDSARLSSSSSVTSRIFMAAKSRRGGKKKPPPMKISAKGFGSITTPAGGRLLSEPKYEALYEWLRASPLTNLRKVAVADFGGLRGVMALQDIDKGEEIVGIPATFAVDLGGDARDPLPAAQRLLATRAMEVSDSFDADDEEVLSGSDDRAAYWATLPPPDSPDLCT